MTQDDFPRQDVDTRFMGQVKDPVQEIREIRDRISEEVKDLSFQELRERYIRVTEELRKGYGLDLRIRFKPPRKKK